MGVLTTIGSDALLLAIAAVNLYCMARILTDSALRWRWVILVAVTAMLSVLTRLSGWAVFVFDIIIILYVFASMLWGAYKRTKTGNTRLALGTLILLAMVVYRFRTLLKNTALYTSKQHL